MQKKEIGLTPTSVEISLIKISFREILCIIVTGVFLISQVSLDQCCMHARVVDISHIFDFLDAGVEFNMIWTWICPIRQMQYWSLSLLDASYMYEWWIVTLSRYRCHIPQSYLRFYILTFDQSNMKFSILRNCLIHSDSFSLFLLYCENSKACGS